jgi:hypothetical protein
MHVCTTNSESELNPISRCCGIEADDDTPLSGIEYRIAGRYPNYHLQEVTA